VTSPETARAVRAPRLVGITLGDPYDQSRNSAIPYFLFAALERRGLLRSRVDVSMTRLQRLAAAGSAFAPSRRRWSRNYRRRAFRAHSLNSLSALRELPVDAAIQVFRGFQTLGRPYLLYLDTTARLSRSWTERTPFDEDELGEVVERQLYRRAEHVFTMGSPAASSLVRDYELPPAKVTVVGGGMNFDSMPAAGPPEREPIVLFIGRDYLRKGGDSLVEAFRLVKEAVPDARLQLVGTRDPPALPGIERLGWVHDRAEVADLYRRARVFCLPSRFEPYGLALVEAMAHGLPCVGTNAGAMPEIVSDGETGLLVPPGNAEALADALRRLLQDEGYARRLGAAGRARVERELTWDRVVDRMTPALSAEEHDPPITARSRR
jgi:alpha-maltose-1-phosphate synthase